MNTGDSRFILAQLNTWTARFKRARALGDAKAEEAALEHMDARFKELQGIYLTPQAPCDQAIDLQQEGEANG